MYYIEISQYGPDKFLPNPPVWRVYENIPKTIRDIRTNGLLVFPRGLHKCPVNFHLLFNIIKLITLLRWNSKTLDGFLLSKANIYWIKKAAREFLTRYYTMLHQNRDFFIITFRLHSFYYTSEIFCIDFLHMIYLYLSYETACRQSEHSDQNLRDNYYAATLSV